MVSLYRADAAEKVVGLGHLLPPALERIPATEAVAMMEPEG